MSQIANHKMSQKVNQWPEKCRTWYRGFIQGKTRIMLAWIFVVVLGLAAKEYPTWPGIVLCFLGATLRYWASGYLRKDSRPAVGGPYAYGRNPLYLGTYLMALGTIWATGNWVLLACVTFLFAAIYHYIILDEEEKLERIFGSPYFIYCKTVPRFFPRIWPALSASQREALLEVNPDLDHHRFSKELAAKNKAYEAYVSFLGLMGFVCAAAWIWKNFLN